MTYILRDRSDGMIEIVMSKPILIGIFPDSDAAERYRAFLAAEEPELPEEEPSGFATAAADVADAVANTEDLVRSAMTPKATGRLNLPVVVEKPVMPVQIETMPSDLGDDDKMRAFGRIQQGEKIAAVASDFGVTMGQLRGMWANHKRQMQKYLAEGGQEPCTLCKRDFTPSVSNPDTCARCSK